MSNIQETHRGDPQFPKRLLTIPCAPKHLYYLGSLPKEEAFAVAVIGARQCTPYGRVQAFTFSEALSQAGVQVISGLARGIDTQGHKGALAGGTPTFAVLGCGLDVFYPKENAWLYQRIVEQGGGILSEYPPGTPPLACHFPARNRLISGLSDLVFVVEATEHSGSLITVNYALEQGKTVYALPGAVNAPTSQGTNKLLFDGAGVALTPQTLLQELGLT